MKNQAKAKNTAVVVTVFFIATLVILGYTIKVDKVTKKNLHNEKVKSEKLLSSKLNLEKQIVSFKSDISDLQGKNKELDKYLANLKSNLTEKEKHLAKLTKENAGIDQLKKENQEINSMRDQLITKVSELNKNNESLNSEMMALRKENANLKHENNQMMAQLNDSRDKQITQGTAGNFRIEPAKKNASKLTVRAKRTNSVQVSFDAPIGSAGSYSDANLKMILQKPEGGDVAGIQKTDRIAGQNLTASISGKQVAAINPDRVNITFTPKEKLKEGIYTIIIQQGDARVGSAQVRLTK